MNNQNRVLDIRCWSLALVAFAWLGVGDVGANPEPYYGEVVASRDGTHYVVFSSPSVGDVARPRFMFHLVRARSGERARSFHASVEQARQWPPELPVGHSVMAKGHVDPFYKAICLASGGFVLFSMPAVVRRGEVVIERFDEKGESAWSLRSDVFVSDAHYKRAETTSFEPHWASDWWVSSDESVVFVVEGHGRRVTARSLVNGEAKSPKADQVQTELREAAPERALALAYSIALENPQLIMSMMSKAPESRSQLFDVVRAGVLRDTSARQRLQGVLTKVPSGLPWQWYALLPGAFESPDQILVLRTLFEGSGYAVAVGARRALRSVAERDETILSKLLSSSSKSEVRARIIAAASDVADLSPKFLEAILRVARDDPAPLVRKAALSSLVVLPEVQVRDSIIILLLEGSTDDVITASFFQRYPGPDATKALAAAGRRLTESNASEFSVGVVVDALQRSTKKKHGRDWDAWKKEAP